MEDQPANTSDGAGFGATEEAAFGLGFGATEEAAAAFGLGFGATEEATAALLAALVLATRLEFLCNALAEAEARSAAAVVSGWEEFEQFLVCRCSRSAPWEE